ncbi:29642_t:CDS:2, partial [Gigaspora margarita]
MPSHWKPEMDKTDCVIGSLNIRKLRRSSMSNEYYKRAKFLAEKIKQKTQKCSFNVAETLGNLPSILCQVGGGERFLDSNILFSFKASNPSIFQLPKYATTNFINSTFKKPILEVYDATCHCFQK